MITRRSVCWIDTATLAICPKEAGGNHLHGTRDITDKDNINPRTRREVALVMGMAIRRALSGYSSETFCPSFSEHMRVESFWRIMERVPWQ
jgi:hypothetical protein